MTTDYGDAPKAKTPEEIRGSSRSPRTSAPRARRRRNACRAADGVSFLASLTEDETWLKGLLTDGPRAAHGDLCGDPPLRAVR